jgi:cyclic di-GMP phosphodiesterase
MENKVNNSLEKNMHAKILIVDDENSNISLIEMILSYAGYSNVQSTNDPRQVKDLYLENDFDIILLDIRMPHFDGFQVMQQLSDCKKDSYLPILVLTAQDDIETLNRALESGAKDFLTKPFNRVEMLNRVANILEVRTLYNERINIAKTLEQRFRERTRELHDTRLMIIQRLGRAGEYRDNETGMHVIRMSKSSQQLALATGLGESYAELILNASPMHDVGKIGISDSILLKPGKLNDNEYRIMKTHAQIGADIIGKNRSVLMTLARTIALTHHEKWDGSGYPNGLKGEEIPLEGRISAICDVFDALTSARPYKQAWPIEKAILLINEESGKHFDPELVLLFNKILPQVIDIGKRYSDESESSLSAQSIIKNTSERIEFKASYLLGNETIDSEHKLLFEAINNIYDAIIDGDLKLSQKLFMSFQKQTAEHFVSEEKILLGLNYPKIEEHCAYHKELLVMAKATATKCLDMKDETNMMTCFDEMIQFVINDIITGDVQFKSHLKNTSYEN